MAVGTYMNIMCDKCVSQQPVDGHLFGIMWMSTISRFLHQIAPSLVVACLKLVIPKKESASKKDQKGALTGLKEPDSTGLKVTKAAAGIIKSKEYCRHE